MILEGPDLQFLKLAVLLSLAHPVLISIWLTLKSIVWVRIKGQRLPGPGCTLRSGGGISSRLLSRPKRGPNRIAALTSWGTQELLLFLMEESEPWIHHSIHLKTQAFVTHWWVCITSSPFCLSCRGNESVTTQILLLVLKVQFRPQCVSQGGDCHTLTRGAA